MLPGPASETTATDWTLGGAQCVRNTPSTEADRPPGSVAVSVARIATGSGTAGSMASQSAAASARNHTSPATTSGFGLSASSSSVRTCSVSTSAAWPGSASATA